MLNVERQVVSAMVFITMRSKDMLARHHASHTSTEYPRDTEIVCGVGSGHGSFAPMVCLVMFKKCANFNPGFFDNIGAA